jgi:hypothetical protein
VSLLILSGHLENFARNGSVSIGLIMNNLCVSAVWIGWLETASSGFLKVKSGTEAGEISGRFRISPYKQYAITYNILS